VVRQLYTRRGGNEQKRRELRLGMFPREKQVDQAEAADPLDAHVYGVPKSK